MEFSVLNKGQSNFTFFDDILGTNVTLAPKGTLKTKSVKLKKIALSYTELEVLPIEVLEPVDATEVLPLEVLEPVDATEVLPLEDNISKDEKIKKPKNGK